MEAFLISVTIAVCVIFILAVLSNFGDKKEDEYIAKINDNFKSLIADGFKPSLTIDGFKTSYYFSVDTNGKKIAITTYDGNTIIPFNSIISVELLEDNKTVLTKSTSRSIGGALIGGALAGEAGAVIGGLSGNATTNKKVSTLKVKIKVRDIKNPSYVITCFDAHLLYNQSEINVNGTWAPNYKVCLDTANKIMDTISVIIDSEDKKNNTEVPPKTNISNSSVVDELEKLVDLKDRGALSEDEFNDLKKKLLK